MSIWENAGQEMRGKPIAAGYRLMGITAGIIAAVLFVVPYLRDLPDVFYVIASYGTVLVLLVLAHYPLRHYFPPVRIAKPDRNEWEGRAIKVSDGNGKTVYLVWNGRRHPLHEWIHLRPLGIGREHLYLIPRKELEALPQGIDITNEDDTRKICLGEK